MKPTLYHQTENTNDFELSTAVHTDATDNYGDPHFHKNMELLLVLCGTCECTVGNSNYLLKSGEAILILPYQSHAFFVPSGARVRRVTFTALLILTLAKGIEGRSAGTPVFLPSADTFAYFNAQLSGALGEGLECHRQLETIVRMKVKGILYMIGSEFLASAELTPNGLSTTLAEELIRYIEENFRRDVTLHELAERTGYNYQYLSRSFNKAFGVSFKQMLNRYRLSGKLDCDLLKAGHHGSDTSSGQEFLNAVTPAYAVISVGEGNTYDHPKQETLTKYEAMGIQFYRTDKEGSIVFTTTGGEPTKK